MTLKRKFNELKGSFGLATFGANGKRDLPKNQKIDNFLIALKRRLDRVLI